MRGACRKKTEIDETTGHESEACNAGDGGQYVLKLGARSLFLPVRFTSVLRIGADSKAGFSLCLEREAKLGTRIFLKRKMVSVLLRPKTLSSQKITAKVGLIRIADCEANMCQ